MVAGSEWIWKKRGTGVGFGPAYGFQRDVVCCWMYRYTFQRCEAEGSTYIFVAIWKKKKKKKKKKEEPEKPEKPKIKKTSIKRYSSLIRDVMKETHSLTPFFPGSATKKPGVQAVLSIA